MDKNQKLGLIFNELAKELNISKTDYDRAVTSYTALGKFMKEHNNDWDIKIYPQGSFELGTVVKPITEEDQYDVDLIVEIKVPSFTAEDLRIAIINLLESYGRYKEKVEEKKPCLRISYAESAQFHMDIACARPIRNGSSNNIIEISRKGQYGYYYENSNPLGYIDWFKNAMRFHQIVNYQKKIIFEKGETEIEPLTLQNIKTPLQKAIQILKRHRDIVFKDDLENRPSSIIITTLCAMAYNGNGRFKFITESFNNNDENNNIYLIIKEMLSRVTSFITINQNLEYELKNPSLKEENFLKKWNTNPLLKHNFDYWIRKAQIDIIENPIKFIENSPKNFKDQLSFSFGESIVLKSLNNYGALMGKLNNNKKININKNTLSTTILSEEKDIIKPKSNTYYGG